MNKLFSFKKYFVSLLILGMLPFYTKASHAIGAEWTYKLIAPNQYEVTLVIYRDAAGIQLCANCQSGTTPIPCSQTINITGFGGSCNNVNYGTQILNYVTTEPVIDVVDVCTNVSTISRNCNTRTPGTFTPGIERYVFRGIVNLSTLPASCCQVSLSFATCCRNGAITTLQNPGAQTLYSNLLIDRCINVVGNSSPRFSLAPIIVVKNGNEVMLNNGVFDDEGDSISINFGQALGANGVSAPYASPYSANVPFPYAGAPGQSPPLLPPLGIQTYPNHGSVRFRPQGTFTSLLILEYGEWRKINGVYQKLSTTRRETQIYSQTTPANNNPVFKAYNENGVFINQSQFDSIRICPSINICRTYGLNDLDINDTTDITWVMDSAMIKSGATVTRLFNATNRNTTGPRFDSIKFCWTPSAAQQRSLPYLFVLSGKDRTCPVPNKNTRTTLFYIGNGAEASLQKIMLNANTYKFKHNLGDTSKFNPLLTLWQIENTPGSSTYTSFNNDSVNSHVFSGPGGWYRIRLNLNFTGCGSTLITDSVFISKLSLSITNKVDVKCKGDSTGSFNLTINGGLTPFSYRLGSTGNWQTIGSFSNLKAANYWVFGRDSLLTTDSILLTILQPDSSLALTISSQQNIACRNDSTGSLVFNVTGGTRPYLTLLNNDSSNQTLAFANLKAAVYQFKVIDKNACQQILNATITQPNTQFNAGATVVQKNCFSDVGSITVIPSGGNAPYFYGINGGTLLTNATFTNLNHGVYVLKARDFNGCERTLIRAIDTVTQLLVNVNKTEPSCGLSNGIIQLSASGGKAPYRYKLGAGAYVKDSIFSNLTSGSYSVSVIDTNNCITGATILLNSSSLINLNFSSTPESCNGANDGTATVIASGGTLPYSFQWSSNPIQTSPTAIGLKSSWYTLRLIDAALCSKIDSVQVMQKPTISAQPLCIISTDTSFNYSVLAWQKNVGLGIAAYNIYRSNTSSGPWNLIQTHPYGLPALVADTLATINSNRAYYQITALDSCNTESSASAAHRGLLLTISAVGIAQKLDWTAYEGSNLGTGFEVFRRVNGNNFINIASLPITNRTYTDSSVLTGSRDYIIEMNWTGNCVAAPFNRVISNKVTVTNTGLLQNSRLSSNLIVYPNPAKGVLYVETENRLAQILNVELYSLSGVLVGNKESNGTNKILLEMNDLAKGMYLLKVKLENGKTETLSVFLED